MTITVSVALVSVFIFFLQLFLRRGIADSAQLDRQMAAAQTAWRELAIMMDQQSRQTELHEIAMAPEAERPFLLTIANNRGETWPRLMFSDWLEECGECERAATMRDEAKRMESDPRRTVQPRLAWR